MAPNYEERAAECWRLANETTNPIHRASLIEMAQAWMRLHDLALRNAQCDLTYETPPRPEAVRQPLQQQQQQQQQPTDHANKDEK